jgi:uncharacterized protein (DUF4415 family)
MGKNNGETMERVRSRGKEPKMSEERRNNEIARRERAQAHAGEVVAGSGSRGKPRRMAQMVSVRLDGEIVSRLRNIAEQRGVSVSDLLREGAQLILDDAYASAQPRASFRISGAHEALPTAADDRAYAAH